MHPIAQYRKETNYTYRQMAFRMGCHSSHLKYVEIGERITTPELLAKIKTAKEKDQKRGLLRKDFNQKVYSW